MAPSAAVTTPTLPSVVEAITGLDLLTLGLQVALQTYNSTVRAIPDLPLPTSFSASSCYRRKERLRKRGAARKYLRDIVSKAGEAGFGLTAQIPRAVGTRRERGMAIAAAQALAKTLREAAEALRSNFAFESSVTGG